MGRGNFDGERAAHCKVLGHSAVICAKMVEPIEMLSLVNPRNYVLDRVQISHGRGNFEGEGHAQTCPMTLM